MNANYNDLPYLWENMRRNALAKGAASVLTVTECGHILQGAEALARCTDQQAAMALLSAAGWRHMAGNALGTFYTV